MYFYVFYAGDAKIANKTFFNFIVNVYIFFNNQPGIAIFYTAEISNLIHSK